MLDTSISMAIVRNVLVMTIWYRYLGDISDNMPTFHLAIPLRRRICASGLRYVRVERYEDDASSWRASVPW